MEADHNGTIWKRFTADPRTSPDLRAADTDRAVVFEVLGEAFAVGQLDAEEHTERMDRAAGIKTLGDAVPLLSDIVTASEPPSDSRSPASTHAASLEKLTDDDIPMTPEAITASAERYWKQALGGTLTGFIAPTAICLTVWLATGAHTFFWPLFVILGTGMGLFNVVVNRRKLIEDRKKVLTKRARARLGDEAAQRDIEEHPGRYALDDDDRSARRAARDARRRHRGRRRSEEG